MKPEEDFAGRQITGARETQDDFYGFGPLAKDPDGLNGVLLVVADGMGGYMGGAIASRLVAESFVESFYLGEGAVSRRLEDSLMAAEKALHQKIVEVDPSLSQMGSTLVAAVVSDGILQWASVGDSALYLYRAGAVKRINADHSMAPVLAQQVAEGKMTAEAAATHPQRNVLRTALTSEPLKIYEIGDPPVPLQAGDIIIAASDGLASVPAELLAEKLLSNADEPASRIAEVLLITVNEARKQKQDNATVAVIKQPAVA